MISSRCLENDSNGLIKKAFGYPIAKISVISCGLMCYWEDPMYVVFIIYSHFGFCFHGLIFTQREREREKEMERGRGRGRGRERKSGERQRERERERGVLYIQAAINS